MTESKTVILNIDVSCFIALVTAVTECVKDFGPRATEEVLLSILETLKKVEVEKEG